MIIQYCYIYEQSTLNKLFKDNTHCMPKITLIYIEIWGICRTADFRHIRGIHWNAEGNNNVRYIWGIHWNAEKNNNVRYIWGIHWNTEENKRIRRIVVHRPETTLILKYVNVKVTAWRKLKGLVTRIHMPNINAPSLILQKIWARLKFLWQTDKWMDRQTNRKTDRWMSFNVPHICKMRGTIMWGTYEAFTEIIRK